MEKLKIKKLGRLGINISKSIVLILLFSCSNSNNVSQNNWKYQSGFYIGDVLNFENGVFSIKNDTIYKRNKFEAIVHNKSKNSLSIISSSGKIGYYVIF